MYLTTLLISPLKNSSAGLEFWKSDGTTSGTYMIKDIYPGGLGSMPQYFVMSGNRIYFSAHDDFNTNIWISDGTSLGTFESNSLIRPLGSGPKYLTKSHDKIFFNAIDTSLNYELWVTDATESGTNKVKELTPGIAGSNPNHLFDFNGKLLFSSYNVDPGFNDLFITTGTDSSTILLGKFYDPDPVGINPLQEFIVYNNECYFSGSTLTNGFELWKTDGTVNGTVMVKDINPGPASSYPGNFIIYNGYIFFSASDGQHGGELWQTDGTETGTALLDIIPGNSGLNPGQSVIYHDSLFFTATSSDYGLELWKSDGSVESTQLFYDINPGVSGSYPSIIGTCGSYLYFMATDGTSGYEVWRTDGSPSGTMLLADMNPGSADSFWNPEIFNCFDSLQFFWGNNGLWRSDGTTAGTFLHAEDFCHKNWCYSVSSLASDSSYLYFVAENDSIGSELWRTNTNANSVELVADIYPGYVSSVPNGLFYF
ncbi:MAG: hypothetical protein IPO83_01340 [Chitinophagaceae bacterium]|nr:hypothetical protein [Chitinophagaceae bacterium]